MNDLNVNEERWIEVFDFKDLVTFVERWIEKISMGNIDSERIVLERKRENLLFLLIKVFLEDR